MRRLDLGGTEVTQVGLWEIEDMAGLERLSLGNSKVSQSATVELCEKIPGLHVYWYAADT